MSMEQTSFCTSYDSSVPIELNWPQLVLPASGGHATLIVVIQLATTSLVTPCVNCYGVALEGVRSMHTTSLLFALGTAHYS